ncbi:MAG: type II toxin-antitoxin system HigB family toxin [Elusimicrobia bacterium]|nr:type II toxin-antitoxin system HigB family toxin [Elusimicrobiota bacterium]
MRIIGRDLIKQFEARHPDAKSSLNSWVQACEGNAFKHFIELRKALATADPVPPHTVFNISGNKYRLIALVNYCAAAIQVTHIMTHEEYDKGRWRKRP